MAESFGRVGFVDSPVAEHSSALGSVASDPHWRLRRGANVTETGVHFSVWAPTAQRVTMVLSTGVAAGDHSLSRVEAERGVWATEVAGAEAGDRYAYRIDDSAPLPDPVSRSQPEGVHKFSEVVDPSTFTWADYGWQGMTLADFVLYEVHVGTFTAEGTFDSTISKLADLREIGINAIELMPVASFPGGRNWGYDGVHFYAPQATYGGTAGLKRLVDAAHNLGMAVVLDVVYNHVGPEGNYLDSFGPYHTDIYRTPWGRAINYDGWGSDAVRRWAHDNALYWLSEFHVDALRLDAVQGIYDFGALGFLEELSDEVHELGRQTGRKMQLMAESDLNDPRLIRSPQAGGFGLDAQWSDDVHHTIHTTLTGESNGYYQDFAGIATMADVYREPFFYARRYAPHRDRIHGRSSAHIPRQRFIVAAQNHDQVGNRPFGERLTKIVPPDRQRLAAALVALSPYVPLFFMGEEYGEVAPFLYFIEHSDPELIEAVRAGRQREYDRIGKKELPSDPQSAETFDKCKLDWTLRETDSGRRRVALYRDLLALRREEPALRSGDSEAHVQGAADWMTVLRILPLKHDGYDPERARRAVLYVFNLSQDVMNIPVRADAIGGWTMRFNTDAVGYGGSGATIDDIPTESRPDDAPKRLMAPAAQPQGRVIRMPAWSAAVFVRTLDEQGLTL